MTTIHERPKPDDEAVDGFTWREIDEFVRDSIVQARCTECGDYAGVEPDARDYECASCGAEHSITSPLVKLGLI